MAQNTGNGDNQSPMAEDETFDDLQEILNPSVRPSNSLPAMPSHEQAMVPATPHPHIIVTEQPTNRTIRFRYKCEGRTAGSIPGMNSQPNAKTYPTIQICDYDDPVYVVITCVNHKWPYSQHPHHLVSKDEAGNCSNGIYTKKLARGERRLELQKVGIQCVKKTEVRSSLCERQKKNVDPFNAGFGHMDDVANINLYQLRLCFQAFITVDHKKVALDPVVSAPIYGKSNDLTINKICSCSSKMNGGDEIIMLCEKVAKNDIKIRFFETNADGDEIWEDFGIFTNTDVYKQTAIAFKTPRYHNPETQHSVNVELQLVRKSDGATSAPLPFEYYPNPGMLTFARLQRKLKRKQELDVFQQILSLDSETTATKYSCPPVELNDDENTVSSDDQQSSGTLNDFEIAVKKLQLRHRGESEATATEYTDGFDNDNDQDQEDMGIELEVPQLMPQLADDCTQTSTPMEEILQQPQLQSRPLSNVDKINEWMKSGEFERTDSLTVENGDTPTLSHSTAQTAFTNVSSLTANTTITNQLDDEDKLEDGDGSGSRRDTLESATLKELPVGEELLPTGEESLSTGDKSLPAGEDSLPDPELVSASAQASVDIDENFDETATYTSLQIAYNHPVEMPKNQKSEQAYHATNPFSQLDEAELVVLTNPPAPKIKVNAVQTPATPPSPPLPLPPRTPSPDPDSHRLPPLPPKPRHSQDLSVSEQSVSNSVSLSRSRNGSVSSARTTPSPIIIMRTPDQSPTKRLPSGLPTGLPSSSASTSATASPKKRQGFFSRLFSRRRSRADDEETQSVSDTMTQRYRQNAINSTENLKRKFPGIFSQNTKQSRLQSMETLIVPQLHVPTYQGSQLSPTGTYMQEIKHEQTIFQMDSTRSCPSVASSNNGNCFPLSSSPGCSRESLAPMSPQRLQQLHQQLQQQQQLPETNCPNEQDLMTSLGHLTMTETQFPNTFVGSPQGTGYQQLNSSTAASFVGSPQGTGYQQLNPSMASSFDGSLKDTAASFVGSPQGSVYQQLNPSMDGSLKGTTVSFDQSQQGTSYQQLNPNTTTFFNGGNIIKSDFTSSNSTNNPNNNMTNNNNVYFQNMNGSSPTVFATSPNYTMPYDQTVQQQQQQPPQPVVQNHLAEEATTNLNLSDLLNLNESVVDDFDPKGMIEMLSRLPISK